MTRSSRDRKPNEFRPLKRKPKQLEDNPEVFYSQSAGAGHVIQGGDGRAPSTQKPPPGSAGVSVTDEEGVSDDADGNVTVIDSDVLERARQITAQLTIPKPRRDRSLFRGAGRMAPMRYSGFSDEIDIDRTLEVLAEKPIPEPDDIIVTERIRSDRTVVLLVDVSGSMKGERILTAAAAVGALAAELSDDGLGVIAFWSNAAVLSIADQRVSPSALLRELLALPTQGLTNISFPLELAREQLSRSRNRDVRAILLSDCVHNAGPDPRIAAAMLPRLDVLIDVSGEKDIELGRDIARAGRGTAHLIHTHRDVAPALTKVFN